MKLKKALPNNEITKKGKNESVPKIPFLERMDNKHEKK